MVRSKSSGHLSESQSSLLGAPTTGERFLGASSSSSSGERRFLGERFHPGERLLTASSGERRFLGERFQAGENRTGTTSSLPISLPPPRLLVMVIVISRNHHPPARIKPVIVICDVLVIVIIRSNLLASTSPYQVWDQRCRLIFPTLFIIFNILYWTLLLRTS